MTEVGPIFFPRSKVQMRLFWLAIMSLAAAFRFVNLGQLGLWGDEGYSALSAQAILDYGYPLLPSGGIYPRSLVFLYFEALSVKAFGLNEFALRFPAAIMGLLAILMSYKLSQRLFGKNVALVVVVLMAFSNWEIEFSRNARMYTFFQFFFLLSVYVFYRAYIEGEKRYQWFVIPVWIFTVFVHQLSITLMAILIIPLFLRNIPFKKKWILLPGLILFSVLWVGGNQFQRYLRYGEIPLKQAGNGSGSGGKRPILASPSTDLIEVITTGGGVTLFIFMGLVTLLVLFLVHRSLKSDEYRIEYFYLLLIVGASFFNQIALTLVLLVGYTLIFFKDLQSWKQKPFLIACAICISSFFFWVILGLFQGFELSRILSLTLQYPYLKDRFLKYYLPGWPQEMILASLGMLLLWKSAILYHKEKIIFALLSFIGPVLLLSFANAHDNSARYSFHLFPFLLMFEAYAFVYLSQKYSLKKMVLVPVSVVVLFFVLSDTRLTDLGNVMNRGYGDAFERPIPMSRKSYTFYPDYQSTSQYIKESLSEGDIVVSMRELIPFHYIQKIDYIWTGAENIRFSPLLNDTNAKKISRSGILSLLSNDELQRVWFLSDPFRIAQLEKNEVQDSLSFLANISDCMVYRGHDRKTTVYLISSEKNCLRR